MHSIDAKPTLGPVPNAKSIPGNINVNQVGASGQISKSCTKTKHTVKPSSDNFAPTCKDQLILCECISQQASISSKYNSSNSAEQCETNRTPAAKVSDNLNFPKMNSAELSEFLGLKRKADTSWSSVQSKLSRDK